MYFTLMTEEETQRMFEESERESERIKTRRAELLEKLSVFENNKVKVEEFESKLSKDDLSDILDEGLAFKSESGFYFIVR